MIPLSILLPGIAIAAAVAVAGVQSYRLNSCQADAAAQKAQVAILGASLAEQNRAVETMRSDGIRRQQEGAKALAKAQARARTWDADATRLRAALTARKPDGPRDCAAAWGEIRRGK